MGQSPSGPHAEWGFLPFWKPRRSAHPWLLSSLPPAATAPQQEADAEVNSETLNKPSQGSSSSTPAAPAETASTSKEKEAPAEKSKDSGSVSSHSLGARDTSTGGRAGSAHPSPCLPPLRVPRGRRRVCTVVKAGRLLLVGGGSVLAAFLQWACGPGLRDVEPEWTLV